MDHTSARMAPMPEAVIVPPFGGEPEEPAALPFPRREPEAGASLDLLLGDCLEILPKLGAGSVDLIVTDPPYFLDGLDNGWRKGGNGVPKGTGAVGGLPIGMKFDPRQGRRLQAFMEEAGRRMLAVAKPGAFAVVFSQPRLAHRMAVGLEDAGFEVRDLLAWHFTHRAQFKAFSMNHFVDRMNIPEQKKAALKRSMAGRKTPQLRPQFEAMILAQKPKEGTHIENWSAYGTGLIDAAERLNGLAPSTVMKAEKPPKEKYNCHLTVKPLQLLRHLIRLFSLPGQVVLDPFLGSGSTAIAAMQEGRACIGVEINESYMEIAEKRIQESGK